MWWPDKVLHKKVTITSKIPPMDSIKYRKQNIQAKRNRGIISLVALFFLSSSSSPSSSPAIHFAN